ncbi:cyp2k1: Cytochrome protein [Crotalus adamanteus]|uniref:Cyp2k1: Cytochrome protein n=1 Tax=Crotalus adamanteus TaxID=8729 RepID=A0AAW1C988_CROAD
MDWIGPILILLLFILAIMFLLKKGSSRNNSFPNLPPGLRTMPILGNLHMVDLKRPYRTMMEEMVVLIGYKMVKEALVN